MHLLSQGNLPWLTIGLVVVVIGVAIALLILKSLVIAKPTQAIVRYGAGGSIVSFDRSIVIPFLHQHEFVTIVCQKLRYERSGEWALRFKCGTRAELVADLCVRVNKKPADIRRAAQFCGTKTINDPASLREHFSSMFNDSLETVAGKFIFEEFRSGKDNFRELLLEHIGNDLSGLVLEDVCLHHLQEA